MWNSKASRIAAKLWSFSPLSSKLTSVMLIYVRICSSDKSSPRAEAIPSLINCPDTLRILVSLILEKRGIGIILLLLHSLKNNSIALFSENLSLAVLKNSCFRECAPNIVSVVTANWLASLLSLLTLETAEMPVYITLGTMTPSSSEESVRIPVYGSR